MSYSTPAAHQLFVVAVFLGLGFLLGLLFELLRFVRRLFAGDGTAAVRVQDVLFCAAAFFVQFFALLAFANGKLRAHLLLSSAAGFLAFRFSAGRPVRMLLDRCCKGGQKCFACLLRPFAAASARLKKAVASAKIRRKHALGQKKMHFAPKKLRKIRKKDLKKEEISV